MRYNLPRTVRMIVPSMKILWINVLSLLAGILFALCCYDISMHVAIGLDP